MSRRKTLSYPEPDQHLVEDILFEDEAISGWWSNEWLPPRFTEEQLASAADYYPWVPGSYRVRRGLTTRAGHER